MSFIQRELDRVSAALVENPQANDQSELYAVQQALSWALDPAGFKRPLAMLRGTQEDLGDCPGCPDPGPS